MHVSAVLLILCGLVTCTVQLDHLERIYLPAGSRSGEPCTQDGKYCIREAECVDKQCVCPEGQSGNGLIACVRQNDFLCEASLDPYLTAFGGAQSILTLPCRYRLSRFFTPNLSGKYGAGFCSFEVFAVTSATDYGEFYQRGMEVNIGIGDVVEKKFVSLDVKNLELVDDDVFRYILSTDHINSSPWGQVTQEVWNGLSIDYYFDPYDHFATLWVEECDTLIKFRPYNYSRDDPVQRFTPGIAIQAPSYAKFPPQYSGLPDSLCGLPFDDPDIYKDLADARKLRCTNVALIYDLLLVGVQQTSGDYQNECTEASNVIKGCLDREEAVNFCSRILSHQRTRKCLLDSYVNIMQTFNKCLQYICFHDNDACRALEKDLEHCNRMHQTFDEIKCVPSKQ